MEPPSVWSVWGALSTVVVGFALLAIVFLAQLPRVPEPAPWQLDVLALFGFVLLIVGILWLQRIRPKN